MSGRIETGPGWELREGRWQDVLADVEADALISDPPYSARTHKGHNARSSRPFGGGEASASGVNYDKSERSALDYRGMEQIDVIGFVQYLAPLVRGWFVVLTDHVLVPDWTDELNDCERYTFAPLPFVAPGSRVRLTGDGPSSWTCWIVPSRPSTKAFRSWGTLPGAYILPPGQSERGADWFVGGKPLWLMRSLVRDYSRPGDLIVDPCAGSGTTLLAAVIEGRRAIGAEMDPATFDLAVARLRRGYTPSMFADVVDEPEQSDLFWEVAP